MTPGGGSDGTGGGTVVVGAGAVVAVVVVLLLVVVVVGAGRVVVGNRLGRGGMIDAVGVAASSEVGAAWTARRPAAKDMTEATRSFTVTASFGREIRGDVGAENLPVWR